eukprot:3903234-Rhodomonas_salina.2
MPDVSTGVVLPQSVTTRKAKIRKKPQSQYTQFVAGIAVLVSLILHGTLDSHGSSTGVDLPCLRPLGH